MRVPILLVSAVLLACCSTVLATPDATAPAADAPAPDAPSTADAATTDAASDAGPFITTLIDTHAHIWPRDKAVNDKYIDAFATSARGLGIRVVLGLHARQKPDRPPTYSTDHDTWTLEAVAKYPDVFVPALNGFDPDDSGSVDYVKTQLATGKWKMIGELDVRNRPKETTTAMNHANLMKIYALAGQYKVPVMVHYDQCYATDCATTTAEYDDALNKNPSTIFIHAHSCEIDKMKAHPNLYCEYETQGAPLPNELLDRVIFGTDEQHPELVVRFQNPQDGSFVDQPYAYAIDDFRTKLTKLSATDAERVAIGNARTIKIID